MARLRARGIESKAKANRPKDRLFLETHAEALREHPQLPSGYATERAAFTGAFPNAPEIPIRVEVGALLGRPIWFRVIEPWTQSAEAAQSFFRPSDSLTSNVAKLTQIGLNLFLIVVLALLARRNLRLGRGDRKNAFRLAPDRKTEYGTFPLVVGVWIRSNRSTSKGLPIWFPARSSRIASATRK